VNCPSASLRYAQVHVWICALSVLIGVSLLPGFTSRAAGACHGAGLGCDTDLNCCSGVCQAGKCAACAADGAGCAVGNFCCSGVCGNGTCCDAGDVVLSNGTCAEPCVTAVDCTGCGAAGCFSVTEGNPVCAPTGVRPPQFCPNRHTTECPVGQACFSGACFTLCP